MAHVAKLPKLLAKAKREGWLWAIKSEADERAVYDGCYYDHEAAEDPICFIESFCKPSIGEWADNPLKLLDWQKDDILRPLFGWKRANGLRRYRKSYIEIAKKNGKTTLFSAVALYGLLGDNEAGAHILMCATAKEQAAQLFNESASMVDKSSFLSSQTKIVHNTKTILNGPYAFIKAMARNAKAAEGKNTHFLLMDELHVWDDRKYYASLKYSMRARKQPLWIEITTAGDNLQGICGEEHDYAVSVRDGNVIDDRFLPVLYINPPDANPEDEETWHRANPSLGLTINKEDFAHDLLQAKSSEAAMAEFKRYSLNIWTGVSAPWVSLNDWKACGEFPVNEAELLGRDCWGGLDLSGNDDLTAFGLVFPWEDDTFKALVWHFCTDDMVAEAQQKGHARYADWVKRGYLISNSGNVIDYNGIFAVIDACAKKYNIKEVAFDSWNSSQLATTLKERGLEMVIFRQGYKTMSPALRDFDTSIKTHRFHHGNNPILNWEAGNLVVKRDEAGNIKPDKSGKTVKDQSRKIDGMVALLMAHDRALINRNADKIKVWTDGVGL